MSISSLCSRHAVQHFTKSETTGTAGSISPTQTSGAVHTCFIQPATANDRMVAGQFDSEISHTIYYDHDPGLAAGDKITFGSRKFFVTNPATNTIEDDRLWKLFALEKGREQ